MNHSQNVKNKTVSMNLPKLSFSASRIYPFKGKNVVGSGKWYQELQFQYTASLDNQISTYDSLLFTKNVWNNMKSGFTHEFPLSLQFRPFRNFSISPQVSYKGVLYTQKITRRWDPDLEAVGIDTLRGMFYGHALNPSISAGYSPQIFGIFQFTNPNSRIQAIRHVMKPSVSFSLVPYIEGISSKMYRQVQVDSTGRVEDYSVFQGNIYGTPSLSRKSGSLSFSLNNILEAKAFNRNDTTGKPQKVNIIDNLGMATSYNIFADSMRWSPFSMVIRTTLLKNISISGNSSFSFYGLDKNGRQTGAFYFSTDKKLLRLTNFSTSIDFSLNQLLQRNSRERDTRTPVRQVPQVPEGMPSQAAAATGVQDLTGSYEFDEYGYMIFDAPWTMNVSYSLVYSKPAFKSNLTQTLSLSGNVALTKKMNITYRTGYDFTQKAITMTQISVTRDLHCWDMSFNWIPNGTMKMWEFSIRVKSAVLSDLKYQRRKDYHDNY
ncbi:MAG: hypothetical protein JXN62_09535, partial [Bacteroidales bacterium]|nr:hypothetical protein [Bacteroidales bacterium]